MPRLGSHGMKTHEYVKYAPLELLPVNGLEMWEGDFSSDDFD